MHHHGQEREGWRGHHRHHGYGWFPWHGVLLVVLGGWWLLGETNVVPFDWSYIGPIAILLVGISILFRRWGWHGGRCEFCGAETNEGTKQASLPTEPGRQT